MPETLVLDSISVRRDILQLVPIDFELLEDTLCKAVAEALTVPHVEGAELTPDDIEVDIIDSVSQKTGANELRIIVFANYFKERYTDRQYRAQQIADAIKPALPDDVEGFVYLRLESAGFARF